MLVQIYEIQTREEAERCIALGVDRIGSVLLSQAEWRRPPLRDVIRATHEAGAKSSLIPLFNDADTLYRMLEYYGPDYVHFCDNLTDTGGRETDLGSIVRFQADLKKKFPEIRITRSIPVPSNGLIKNFPSLPIAKALESVSDLFLIDTWLGKEPVEGFIGITGIGADRELAGQVVRQSRIPVILAGGLSPDNVYDALMEVIPAGADSCTHTNRKDEGGKPVRFEKDFRRVERFVREVRRAEEALGSRRKAVEEKMEKLRLELEGREKALPAHSVRPHQIQAIESLEEGIAALEVELIALTRFRGREGRGEGQMGGKRL